MADRQINVLLIEDNPGDARLIEEMLYEVAGTLFTVKNAYRLSDGLTRIAKGGIDAVLLDLGLPDSSGLDTFGKVHDQAPEVPIVMLTGLDDTELALEGMRMGAQDYLVKGSADGDLLARALRYAIERKTAEARIEHLNSVLKAIRNVNQLIVTETERDSLLRKSCDALVDARGYDAAWLGFLGDDETFDLFVGSGFREDIAHFSDRVACGDHPSCIRDALSKSKRVTVIDKTYVCRDCFFKDACLGRAAAVIRVEHAGRLFGLLAVSFAPDVVVDDEEKGLLAEVASDIGIALHNIEIAEARKVAEDALLESETKYRIVVEQTGQMVYDYDVASGSIMWSGAIEPITGYTNNEFQHLNIDLWEEHIHPDDRKHALNTLDESMRAGTQYNAEYRFRRKDGSYSHVEDHGLFIRYGPGKMCRMLGFMYDITGRKVAEDALLESEGKYRSLIDDVLDTSDVGIFILDDEFKVVWINHSTEKYFGLKREDVIGKDKRQLIRDRIKNIFEDPETFEQKVFITYNNNTYVENFECHVLPGEEQKEYWLEHWSQPIRSGLYKGGRIEHYSDITKQKAAEEMLRVAGERFKTIVETAPSVLMISDAKGKNIYVSPNCEEFTGYDPDELTGGVIRWVHEGDAKRAKNTFERTFHECVGCKDFEYKAVKKNGDVWCASSSWEPLIDAKGAFKGAIFQTIDTTERKSAEDALKKSERKYSEFFRTSRDPVFITTKEGRLVESNDAFMEALGYETMDELLKIDVPEHYENPDDRERFNRTVEQQGFAKEFPANLVKKDGSILNTLITATVLKDRDGDVTGFQGTIRDITDRKAAADALKESEIRYKHLYSMVRLMCDNLPDLIWTKDLESKFIFVNKACCDILLNAMDTDEPIGKDDMYFASRAREAHPENPDYHTLGAPCTGSDLIVMDTKKAQRFDESGNLKGEFVYLDVYKAPFWDEEHNLVGTVGCARIVTKERQAEEQIKRSLQEKEVLLREIHHRVKNNLQVVSSLLNIQAQAAEDKDAINILAEARDRIKTMSLIHSQLYEGSDLAAINMKEFVNRLLGQLLQSYPVGDTRVAHVVHVDDYPFPISVAVPVGLIINELLSNALKHAFNGRDKGKIEVSLTAPEEGRANLTVSDDGVGLPARFDIDKSKTLGLRLVKILAKDQLQGTLEVTSDRGVTFRIEFETETG